MGSEGVGDLLGRNYIVNIFRTTSVLLAALLLAGALATADSGAAVMKDGKKGEVSITETVKVGGITLPAGTYIVQHRVKADEHLMYFTRKGGEAEVQSAPVTCELDPKSPRWRSSAVWLTIKDGGKAIEKIMIKDEKVVYNFQ
jgi:hypothetical protein